MKSVILAAGIGSRLRPHTDDKPKCLVELDGRSILDRQLDVLDDAEIRPVIVVGGYKAELLHRRSLSIKINPDYAETNMVWTMFCAGEELYEEDVIVSYGDILFSPKNLRTIVEAKHDVCVAVDLDWKEYWESRFEDILKDAETLRYEENGLIHEIGRTPHTIGQIQAQFMGLMKFSKRGLVWIKEVFEKSKKSSAGLAGINPKRAYMTDLLQEMIDQGYSVHAIPIRGEWIEIDSNDDLRNPITLQRVRYIAAQDYTI